MDLEGRSSDCGGVIAWSWRSDSVKFGNLTKFILPCLILCHVHLYNLMP